MAPNLTMPLPRDGQVIGNSLEKKGNNWPQMQALLRKIRNNTRANNEQSLRRAYENERESIRGEVDSIFFNQMPDSPRKKALCFEDNKSWRFPGITEYETFSHQIC